MDNRLTNSTCAARQGDEFARSGSAPMLQGSRHILIHFAIFQGFPSICREPQFRSPVPDALKIGLHAIVVDERIVDIEKKNDID